MMKIFDKLDNSNFELFAAQHYNNPQAIDVIEFKEDLNRFKYIKRLLRRYSKNGDLQERLILNHLIIVYNVFGIDAANRMMWFRIDEVDWKVLKTFLVFLHYLPLTDKVDIPLDLEVIKALRNL